MGYYPLTANTMTIPENYENNFFSSGSKSSYSFMNFPQNIQNDLFVMNENSSNTNVYNTPKYSYGNYINRNDITYKINPNKQFFNNSSKKEINQKEDSKEDIINNFFMEEKKRNKNNFNKSKESHYNLMDFYLNQAEYFSFINPLMLNFPKKRKNNVYDS
ncbi:MAG: hypothetical protein MJ252_05995 [archaeon]|nr:hypothetical protein [archaeon]